METGSGTGPAAAATAAHVKTGCSCLQAEEGRSWQLQVPTFTVPAVWWGVTTLPLHGVWHEGLVGR